MSYINEALQQRMLSILEQEAGVDEVDPQQTIGSLFIGNRFGFATALVRMQMETGEEICCTDRLRWFVGQSVEFLLWALDRNFRQLSSEFGHLFQNR